MEDIEDGDSQHVDVHAGKHSSKPKSPMRLNFYNKVKPIAENEQVAATAEPPAHSNDRQSQEAADVPSTEKRSSTLAGRFGVKKKKRLKSAPAERPALSLREDLDGPIPAVSPGVSDVSIPDSGCSTMGGSSRSSSGVSGPQGGRGGAGGQRSRTGSVHSQTPSHGGGKLEELTAHAGGLVSRLMEVQGEWSSLEEELRQARADNEALQLARVQLEASCRQSAEEGRTAQHRLALAQQELRVLGEENGALRASLELQRSGRSGLAQEVQSVHAGLSSTVCEYYNISPNEVKNRLEKLSALLKTLVEREKDFKRALSRPEESGSSEQNEGDFCVVTLASSPVPTVPEEGIPSSFSTGSPLARPSPQHPPASVFVSAAAGGNGYGKGGVSNGCLATSTACSDDDPGGQSQIKEIHDTYWLPVDHSSSATVAKDGRVVDSKR